MFEVIAVSAKLTVMNNLMGPSEQSFIMMNHHNRLSGIWSTILYPLRIMLFFFF